MTAKFSFSATGRGAALLACLTAAAAFAPTVASAEPMPASRVESGRLPPKPRSPWALTDRQIVIVGGETQRRLNPQPLPPRG